MQIGIPRESLAGETRVAATPATVEQVVYRGQVTHLYMRLDDGEPLVAYLANRDGAAPDGARLNVGERVMAHWPASANKVVLDN